jgi:hypothetical protein
MAEMDDFARWRYELLQFIAEEEWRRMLAANIPQEPWHFTYEEPHD